jgi:DNA-binding XRE family transcriptional regulator
LLRWPVLQLGLTWLQRRLNLNLRFGGVLLVARRWLGGLVLTCCVRALIRERQRERIVLAKQCGVYTQHAFTGALGVTPPRRRFYEFIRYDEQVTTSQPKLPTMHSFIPSTIRRFRNQRHLTLENVSGIAGMSVQHLSEIESSKRDPRLSSIERIADAMDLAVMLVPEHMAPEIRRYVASHGRVFTTMQSNKEPSHDDPA